jgi:fatty-acyl-CoA synthase
VHGACDQPLIGATIGEMFDTMALMHSWREALIVPHQQVRWTYAGLKRRVDELALGLMRLGLEPGDRLGIWSPNCAEWVPPTPPPRRTRAGQHQPRVHAQRA